MCIRDRATLVADFRRYGKQIAVVTHRGNRRFSSTYAQLAELSARCAHAFDQRGLLPGDRVLLWGNNSVEWVAAFFGCVLRGIVAVPLDAAGSLELARRVVAEVEPRLLVGDLELLRKLSPGIPTLGFATFSSSMPAPDYQPLRGLSRDMPLQIIFTSGTTAEPKGIVHTHGNVLASLDPLEKEIGKYLRYERFVHPLRILHTLPLSHVLDVYKRQTPTTVLIWTVFPSAILTSVSTPLAGEGISASTLSVEISKRGSSRCTVSPGFFNHLVMVPSKIDSPICGMMTSVREAGAAVSAAGTAAGEGAGLGESAFLGVSATVGEGAA